MKNGYCGFVQGTRVVTKKVWKVFSGSDYSYCYSKDDALRQRAYMQELGFTKVQIKGRR